MEKKSSSCEYCGSTPGAGPRTALLCGSFPLPCDPLASIGMPLNAVTLDTPKLWSIKSDFRIAPTKMDLWIDFTSAISRHAMMQQTYEFQHSPLWLDMQAEQG